MATIALYANKINQMPGLIKDIKRTVTDYKSELSVLKTKTLTINKSICNLDDVISSIQTSTQTQEQKIDSLDTFNQNSENFISDVVRIDSNVADVVKQRKDDFYVATELKTLNSNNINTLVTKVGRALKQLDGSGQIIYDVSKAGFTAEQMAEIKARLVGRYGEEILKRIIFIQ